MDLSDDEIRSTANALAMGVSEEDLFDGSERSFLKIMAAKVYLEGLEEEKSSPEPVSGV